MTNEELRKTMQDLTGKSYSKDLSKKDAGEIIDLLKQKEPSDKTEAH
jgi:hypothetical protein